ncbi:hypothetical protein ES703_09082 [subsurface metagenome]
MIVPKMEWRKYPQRVPRTRTAVSTTFEYVETEPVPVGQVHEIWSHSFENETGARGTIRGYIRRDGYYHWLWEQKSPAAATLYWSVENVVLAEGEILGVRQATNVAGDILQLKLNGVVIFGSEGQVV